MTFKDKLHILMCEPDAIQNNEMFDSEFFHTLRHITGCINHINDLNCRPEWLLNAYMVMHDHDMLYKIDFTIDTIPLLLDSNFFKQNIIVYGLSLSLPDGILCLLIFKFLETVDESHHYDIYDQLSEVLIFKIGCRYKDAATNKQKCKSLYENNVIFKQFIESHRRYVNKLKLLAEYNNYDRFDYMELIDSDYCK